MDPTFLTLSFAERVLEPESMEETAQDYADMDFRKSNQAFIDLMSPMIPRDSLVADFGCGPGDITLQLAKARPDLQIIGVDLSPAMLQIAQNRAEVLGVQSKLEWKLGDITEPLFPEKTLDFAFSHTVLHHLPHLRPFFVQVAKAVQPRGGFCIRDLQRPVNATQAAAWIQEASGDDLNEQQYALFFHSLRASLTRDEVAHELQGTGLDGVLETSSRYWILYKPAKPR